LDPDKSWGINEWADWWRNYIGVNVIPADTKNKKIELSWKKWQTEPIPDDLHKFWCETGEFERNGLAVIMGKCHHNTSLKDLYIWCIDCDNQKAIDEMTQDKQRMAAATLCEWHDDNPSKLHIYGYSHNQIPKKASDKTDKDMAAKIDANEIPSIEVKSDSLGVMFCTPSIHQQGHKYHIGECHTPKIMDGVEKAIGKVLRKYNIPYGSDVPEIAGGIAIDDLIEGDARVLEGHNRHLAMLRVADHYAATMPDLDKLRLNSMVSEKNKTVCMPPLDDAEIEKICTQAMQWVAKNGGLPRTTEKGVIHEDDEGTPVIPKKRGRKNNVELHVIVADQIMENHTFLAIEETGEILYYKGGVYKFGAEQIISKSARKIDANIKRHDIAEITSYIRDVRGYVEISEFDADPTIVNVKNGLYNLRTCKLQPHDHQYYSMMQIPHNYDETVFPHRFLKFLKSCHPDDIRKVKTVIEMMALCLIRNNIAEKSFLNVGSGSNGKSICLDFLGSVLGKHNISTDSIHEISYDRFATSDLLGKYANICADIESHELKNTGNLKKIISGDRIRGQKKYGHAFPFEPSVKMIFSANQLPEVFDDSDGFYRKWEIIQWDRRFFGKDRDFSVKTIKSDKRELSGMLGIMLNNAAILYRTNRLTYARSPRETREMWKEKSDPVDLFISEEVTRDVNSKTPVSDMYTRYTQWCRETDRIPGTHTRFNKSLKKNGYEKSATRFGGETKQAWHGCKLSQAVKSNSPQKQL